MKERKKQLSERYQSYIIFMIYNTVDSVVTEIEIDSCDEIDSKVKRRNRSAYIDHR